MCFQPKTKGMKLAAVRTNSDLSYCAYSMCYGNAIGNVLAVLNKKQMLDVKMNTCIYSLH